MTSFPVYQVLAERPQQVGEPAHKLADQVTKQLHAIEYWLPTGAAPQAFGSRSAPEPYRWLLLTGGTSSAGDSRGMDQPGRGRRLRK
jgi:hypothetical protein